ncbi:MAG: UDP-N-acetylmuramoyl-L-alanyl-D-glutamate--2,6-diaminopimelate ligase [Pseudomonadota bacterium]
MLLTQIVNMVHKPLPEVNITGIKLDSRQVANGDLFVAVPGYLTDGRHYIDDAIESGASAILAEADSVSVEFKAGIPVITMPALKEQLSLIAGGFFEHPASRTKLIGVTGTNGKTSVTHITAQLAKILGDEAAVIGTTGSGLIGRLLPEKHTTPDAVTVQQRLSTLVAEGAQLVAMEVSSHALIQRRVEALEFSVVAATNISRDHLDYHGTMDNYVAAKHRLFVDFAPTQRVINADDALLKQWLDDYPQALATGLSNQIRSPSLTAQAIEYHADGTVLDVCYRASDSAPEQRARVKSTLLGQFNVYNLLTSIGILLSEGYSLPKLAEACASLQPVPGRMEAFQNSQSALIVVDYAHTPDALQQVLVALRKHCEGKLWCVFGCGGDRDRGKRPQMGQVAAEYADNVVVTDDNPRTEPAQQIIADILTGTVNKADTRVIQGRREAVLDTIGRAAKEDVVLLAGKGHEDYQVIGTEQVDYNERAIVAEWLRGDCK